MTAHASTGRSAVVAEWPEECGESPCFCASLHSSVFSTGGNGVQPVPLAQRLTSEWGAG